jgi:hypothetical protein
MPASKRVVAPAARVTATPVAEAADANRPAPPTVDMCNYSFDYIETVLLRRTFFVNPDRTRYFSVGYYPARHYDVFVEIGGNRLAPILLPQHHVRFMAEHLPLLCAAMCNNRPYVCTNDNFKLTTISLSYRIARLTLGSIGVNFKLQDMQYLSRIFFMIHNQQIIYMQALSDVMNYATLTAASTEFVLPPANSNANILYPRLFEELKALM